MEPPYDPVIALLGIYSKNPETPIQKTICILTFITVLFTKAKCWKQPKCPSVDDWIKNLWYIYTMEYYAADRTEFLHFATAWFELDTTMLNEISKSVKDIYHITYKRNLVNKNL